MLAAWKQRKIFRAGAATHEHAMRVNRLKGMDMVQYLRARRYLSQVANTALAKQALNNKAFVRENFLKRKRWGLPPHRV